MRKLFLALLVALVLAGCGGVDFDDPATVDKIIAEAVDIEKLQWRDDELYYKPNHEKPYSGWAKSMAKGHVRHLIEVQDGKERSLTAFYENGQRAVETLYQNKKFSIRGWKPNGEKCPVTKVDENGNGVQVYYDEYGNEQGREIFKNGIPQ
jgi:antitoxin component YwqK of YwqJK toxin-antitoxin module